MPPLESLFDSVMDNFLVTRPDEAEEQEQEEREDEMDVDEFEDGIRPVRGGAPLDRVVDRQEMHGFVELFMKHAIKGVL